jgi:hypothetical protein
MRDYKFIKTWRNKSYWEIQSLTIRNKSIHNQQTIAEAFDTYFLSVVDIMKNKNKFYTIDVDNRINNVSSKISKHR